VVAGARMASRGAGAEQRMRGERMRERLRAEAQASRRAKALESLGRFEQCGAQDAVRDADVVLRGFQPQNFVAAVPSNLTVFEGGSVTWKVPLVSSLLHVIQIRKRGEEDGRVTSGELRAGDEFKHTFGSSGSYEFYCENYPIMGGDILVVGSDDTKLVASASALDRQTDNVVDKEDSENSPTRSNRKKNVGIGGKKSLKKSKSNKRRNRGKPNPANARFPTSTASDHADPNNAIESEAADTPRSTGSCPQVGTPNPAELKFDSLSAPEPATVAFDCASGCAFLKARWDAAMRVADHSGWT
jgi:plastocyanin